ncbi:MAG: tannase/feruloyl esterase family alpha/beta hydrolase, partial [Caulobacteraceae bacterium]
MQTPRIRRLTAIAAGACALLAGALLLDLKLARPVLAAAPGGAGVCDSLKSLNLPSVRVDAVTLVQPQAAWSSTEGARPVAIKAPFCRVQGTIETEIGFELWLPEAGAWNGKFLGAGVGGDAGTFNFQDLPRGVARGYASATTDTGHKAADRTWMLGDPMRLTNYTVRGNHRLAEVSKAIVAGFYGKPARLSYFVGCSGGGRQGLKEMQRFPDDYDGIIAGAPGPDTAEMTARRMWEIIQRESHPGLMSPKDWQLVA